MLEKMNEFFNKRLDGYDEHRLNYKKDKNYVRKQYNLK